MDEAAHSLVVRAGHLVDGTADRTGLRLQRRGGIDLGDDACLALGLIDGHTHLSLAGDGRPYVEMFCATC